MILEGLEYLVQESVSEKHAPGFNFDGGDVVLGGNGFQLAVRSCIADESSRRFRLHGVEQPDRNIVQFGGKNT